MPEQPLLFFSARVFETTIAVNRSSHDLSCTYTDTPCTDTEKRQNVRIQCHVHEYTNTRHAHDKRDCSPKRDTKQRTSRMHTRRHTLTPDACTRTDGMHRFSPWSSVFRVSQSLSRITTRQKVEPRRRYFALIPFFRAYGEKESCN